MFGKKKRAAGIFALTVLTLALLQTGCAGLNEALKPEREETAAEKIQNELNNLQTYQSEATVEYISNKGRNAYDTVQQCKAQGQYRIEVVGPERAVGNITLSDGSTIYQYNARINAKVSVAVKENQERSEIFLTSFIKNYAAENGGHSENAENFTVLEAKVPGEHPYLATEKLWVDNETLKPVKLVVYDPNGGERIVVTYKTFAYNVPLDDSLFTYST